jgi:hypothetical protein
VTYVTCAVKTLDLSIAAVEEQVGDERQGRATDLDMGLVVHGDRGAAAVIIAEAPGFLRG